MGKLELPKIEPDLIVKKEAHLPLYGGVYAFYSIEGILIYLGKTSSFRRRMYLHHQGKLRHLIEFVELYRIDDEVERDIYETYLINKWKPLFNDKKTWSYKSFYRYLEGTENISELHMDGVRTLDTSNLQITEIKKPRRGKKENPVKTNDRFIQMVADFIYPYASKDKSDIRRFLNEQGYSVDKSNQHHFFKPLIEHGFVETKMTIRLPSE